MGMIFEWIGIITTVVTLASIVCALTPTPKDDKLLGKLYKLVELLAINILKAKQ